MSSPQYNVKDMTPLELREYWRLKGREYYQRNKEIVKKRVKGYQQNCSTITAQRNNRYKNLNYKISHNLGGLIRSSCNQISGIKKTKRTEELLGCTIEQFKFHIEALFTTTMNWDNYGKGGWELDHIKPIASFDLTKEQQIKECFHYSNYQPLWAPLNQSKSSVYNGVRYRKEAII